MKKLELGICLTLFAVACSTGNDQEQSAAKTTEAMHNGDEDSGARPPLHRQPSVAVPSDLTATRFLVYGIDTSKIDFKSPQFSPATATFHHVFRDQPFKLDFAKAWTTLVYKVAGADGEVSEPEYKFIVDVLLEKSGIKQFLNAEEIESVTTLHEELFTKKTYQTLTLASAIEEFKQAVSTVDVWANYPPFFKMIVHVSILASKADRTYHEEEEAAVRTLAEAFKVSDADLNFLKELSVIDLREVFNVDNEIDETELLARYNALKDAVLASRHNLAGGSESGARATE